MIIRAMDEKFKEKILMASIAAKALIIIPVDKAPLFIFFIIFIPASNIRSPTAILIPLNALAITVHSKKPSRNMEII